MLIQGETIWDYSRIRDRDSGRLEFPDLVRFKGHWYCAFREAEIHNNHPSGRGRVIRSPDGVSWETVTVLDWDCADVREPKFAITAEGCLMVNTSVYFVSREPREPGRSPKLHGDSTYTPPEARHPHDRPGLHYRLDFLGTPLNLPGDDLEPNTAQQTVTWLSRDGVNWSGAYACPTGVNTWRWAVDWHNGMGYSVAQWGKDTKGALYRTRDGKTWRVLRENFAPKGRCNEGSLAFGEDDVAYCLFRDGVENVVLGVGKPPYYQEWEWKAPDVDYGPEHGGAKPGREALGASLGGPKLIRLSDGRLVGAGRALGPGRDDGRATLFWVDPDRNVLTVFAEMDGTSYPGLVEHAGALWVTFVSSACHRDVWEARLAKVPIPA